MPIIGHAFAGWATAIAIRPPGRPDAERPPVPLWTPTLIGLAFLPDVASQAAILAGASPPTLITHSLFVAGATVPLVGWGLFRWARIAPRAALLIAVLSVPGHVILDLLQKPDRPPFWPVSTAPLGLPFPLLPQGARAEAAVSALLFLGFLALRRLVSSPPPPPTRPTVRRLDLAATALILALATITHHQRSLREDRYEDGRMRLAAGDAAGALRLADEADRWPYPIPPGRLDYMRAEAYEGLGDAARAERFLRDSIRDDPDYFWAWADLCVLYASTGVGAATPRPEATACLDRLRRRFADHPDLPRVLARAERRLREQNDPPP
jgi:hypothetical protein